MKNRYVAAAHDEFTGQLFIQLADGKFYQSLLLIILNGSGRKHQYDQENEGQDQEPEYYFPQSGFHWILFDRAAIPALREGIAK